jgi:hypothetical protein
MAYVRLEYCEKCKTNTHHINSDGCSICLGKKKAEAERMWEAQDIETKVTDLRKRIEYLEMGNNRLF